MAKKSKRILFVLGTRPEALKMAPLVFEAKRRKIHAKVCFTGQHKEIANQVFDYFKLRPDDELNIMKKNQTLVDLMRNITKPLEAVFEKRKPDIVVVQGDTSTAFLVSLVAFYHKIQVAHIEAGLRSFNKYEPFPEEINRKMISHIADWHFAPTKEAAGNLKAEAVDRKTIHVTGNTIIDTLKLIQKKTSLAPLRKKYGISSSEKVIVVTAHRRENFGQGMRDICKALKQIASKHENVRILVTVHPNPNVKGVLRKELGATKNITLLPPQSYLDFVNLMQLSDFMISDSGGVQEEAPTFKKPILVLRNVTERPEGVHMGVAKLVGTDVKKIVFYANKLLTNKAFYRSMSNKKNPYGDGQASRRIITELAKG